jgi:hypothetical protein
MYLPTYLPTYQPINRSVFQRCNSHRFQSPQSPVYASSDVQFPRQFSRSTSAVPLPFPTSLPAVHTFALHPLTGPLSPYATCHAPRTLSVRIISTQYSPFRTKFCSHGFSSNYVISYFQFLQVLTVFLQNSIPVFNHFFFNLRSNEQIFQT